MECSEVITFIIPPDSALTTTLAVHESSCTRLIYVLIMVPALDWEFLHQFDSPFVRATWYTITSTWDPWPYCHGLYQQARSKKIYSSDEYACRATSEYVGLLPGLSGGRLSHDMSPGIH